MKTPFRTVYSAFGLAAFLSLAGGASAEVTVTSLGGNNYRADLGTLTLDVRRTGQVSTLTVEDFYAGANAVSPFIPEPSVDNVTYSINGGPSNPVDLSANSGGYTGTYGFWDSNDFTLAFSGFPVTAGDSLTFSGTFDFSTSGLATPVANGAGLATVLSSGDASPPNAVAFATGTTPGGNGFSAWISGYSVGGMTGVDDDPDGDGVDNGVENFFGTAPDVFSQGLRAVDVVTDEGTEVTVTSLGENNYRADLGTLTFEVTTTGLVNTVTVEDFYAGANAVSPFIPEPSVDNVTYSINGGPSNPVDLSANSGGYTGTYGFWDSNDFTLGFSGFPVTAGDTLTFSGTFDFSTPGLATPVANGAGLATVLSSSYVSPANTVAFATGKTPGGSGFSFTHLQGSLADDLTARYRWSTDLQSFQLDGGTDGAGAKVNFSVQADTPVAGTTTVTANIIAESVPKSLFVDVEVTQD